jgi:hypothetical protein
MTGKGGPCPFSMFLLSSRQIPGHNSEGNGPPSSIMKAFSQSVPPPRPNNLPPAATAPSFKVRAFRHDKPRYRKRIPPLWFKAPFTISRDAFRNQKWSNLTRDDVSRKRLTSPLVSFYGWFGFSAVYSSP